MRKTGPYLVPISEKSDPFLVPFRDFFLVGPDLATLFVNSSSHFTISSNVFKIGLVHCIRTLTMYVPIICEGHQISENRFLGS